LGVGTSNRRWESGAAIGSQLDIAAADIARVTVRTTKIGTLCRLPVSRAILQAGLISACGWPSCICTLPRAVVGAIRRQPHASQRRREAH